MPDATVTIREEANPSIEMVFPMTPAELPETAQVDAKSYRIIGIGTQSFPDGRQERHFSLSGYFPGPGRARSRLVHVPLERWRQPQNLTDRLRAWLDNKTRLQYITTSIAGEVNVSVYLSQYTFTKRGPAGDIGYQLEFVEWRRIRLKTTSGPDGADTSGQDSTSSASGGDDQSDEPNPQTYTVKDGDNLSFIAKRFLGDAGRWNEIFEANRDVIGDNPNQIQTGMVLTIPGGTIPDEDTSGYAAAGAFATVPA